MLELKVNVKQLYRARSSGPPGPPRAGLARGRAAGRRKNGSENGTVG